MGVIDTFRVAASQLTGYFIYLLLVSTIGPLLFGYHLAELNAPQDVVTCKRKSISTNLDLSLPQCIPMTPLQFGLVQSIFTLGGFCGALIAGPLSAQYGRLRVMRYNTFFCAVGPLAEALAPGVGVMALGRFISGVGAGASLVVVPIYISEISPPSQKGFFGSFTQIMTNMGIFITQLLGYFLSHDSMWRVILAVSGGIGLMQLAGLVLAVDSPKWTAQQGHFRQAKLSLRKIRGEDADIQDELDRLQDGREDDEEASLLSHEDDAEDGQRTSNAREQKRALSILEVLYHPRYYKAIIAVMAIMVTQQFTGINSIVMYGVALLADLLAANAAALVLFVTLLNVVVTTACAPLSDIIGRKTCLLISTAGMGLSSVLLAIGIRAHLAALSAICVLIFVASFGVGLGPIPFIMASELVEPEAVGATQSWALAANWIATFVVAQFFPVLNDKLGKGMVYFVFAGLAAFFFSFILWWVPETKGRKTASEAWGWESERET